MDSACKLESGVFDHWLRRNSDAGLRVCRIGPGAAEQNIIVFDAEKPAIKRVCALFVKDSKGNVYQSSLHQ